MLDAVSTLYADGIDRLAQVQKKGLDFATQANNEIIQSWKKIALAVSRCARSRRSATGVQRL